MPAPPPLSLTSHPIARLQHDTFQFTPFALSSFFSVGSSLYLVIRAQYPQTSSGAPATNDLQVWKSTDKTTWALMQDLALLPGETDQGCSFVLSGTVIFILFYAGAGAVKLLRYHRYDTATDTFLADTSITGPGATSLGFTSTGNGLTVLNSGGFIVSQQTPPTGDLNFYLYTPGTDTWGAANLIRTGDIFNVLAQIHDPTSDLTFILYASGSGPIHTLRCATVTAALTFTDVVVGTVIAPARFGSASGGYGQPCINPALNEVVFPFLFVNAAADVEVQAARAPIAATPVFVIDTVETPASLPPGFFVQAWDQNSAAPWFAIPLNGTLYVFYAVDNGDLADASSQCFLYYRTSEAVGVWDSSNIAFTSVVPGEMLAAFPSSVGLFNPVILLGVVNPVTFPVIGSLSDFILFGSPGPAPVTTEVAIMLYGWKLYPDRPCEPPEEVEEAPPVDRAV
jgi:hypothetical protein